VRDEAGNILFTRSAWRDVTDLRKMETELRQAQKMEAIGTLAGGIAHDFNNILATILGYTELALEDVTGGSELEDNLLEVQTAGNRATGLVKQILTFARQTDEEILPLDIGPIAKELVKFIRSSIPTTIAIESSLESKTLVMANPSQIHQILMNLCTNSAHAMEEQGGILHLAIRDTKIGAPSPLLKNGRTAGEYIQITVADTGIGMSADIIESIFEPYFTTKEVGKGTGIGLAVVHGIVKNYNGFIEVDSAVGRGTTFDVFLPSTPLGEVPVFMDYEPAVGGTETILIVDDELPLAKMHAKVLEQLGYRVTVCSDSFDALSVFRKSAAGYDALLTDMTMPGLTGEKLAQACKQLKPALVAIICTGYSELASFQSPAALGVQAVIQKPIAGAELAKTLREVLDSRS
jgi:nitrogen-specific signal transduction histidine kinase/ActR/RegA family two-component response regulator